jgi:hypothetical protein
MCSFNIMIEKRDSYDNRNLKRFNVNTVLIQNTLIKKYIIIICEL